MFHACRRGPASLSRVLRAAPTNLRIPSTRPSILSLSSQCTIKLIIESRWLHVSSQLRQSVAAAEQTRESEQSAQNPEITKFDQLIERNLVHTNVVTAITKGMGHQSMTQVQSMTINQGLHGDDIIAQARTGTGKTLGFLIPTIQNILRKDPHLAERKRYSKARPSDIRAIIISPTRELAEQIAVEAGKLCANTDLRVQVAVGGNSKLAMLRKMQMEGCHLLVATPGRLNDLLTDQYSRVSAPNLNTLVLDEADRLLDDGFSKDIEDIIELLPERAKVDRQTLLFSATVPREVMHLVRRTLKPDFHFVQTVNEGEPATHEKVPQKIVAAPGIENFMPSLVELAKREIEKNAKGEGKPFKAIVYFSSTANVELAARIFEELRGEGKGVFGRHPLYPAEISEMHGQLTQQRRTRVSERFRHAKSAILFSTDVTARGMDFPNVTHVIQVGLPPNREQYIHRIGRTGRGDKTGEGWTFIAQDELPDARKLLRGLPISADKTLATSQLDMTQGAQVPTSVAEILSQLSTAIKMVDRETKYRAYLAALGQSGGNARNTVLLLNQWTKYGWGWPEPPVIPMLLAQKLGIARVPGANVDRGHRRDDDLENTLNGPPRMREGRLDSRGGRGGFGGGLGGGRGFDGGRGFGGGRGGVRGGDRGRSSARSNYPYQFGQQGGGRRDRRTEEPASSF